MDGGKSGGTRDRPKSAAPLHQERRCNHNTSILPFSLSERRVCTMHFLGTGYHPLHSILATSLSQVSQRALLRRVALRPYAPISVPCERLRGKAKFRAFSRRNSMKDTRRRVRVLCEIHNSLATDSTGLSFSQPSPKIYHAIKCCPDTL